MLQSWEMVGPLIDESSTTLSAEKSVQHFLG